MAKFSEDRGLSRSVEKIIRNLDKYEKKVEQAFGTLVVDTAAEVRDQAKLRFNKKGTEPRGSDNYGKIPNADTGNLRRAIKSDSRPKLEGRFIVANTFTDNTVENYAAPLEFGTKLTGKGFPYMRPAMMVTISRFDEQFRRLKELLK